MLFLEEPELCLHPGIVIRLAALIQRMQRNTGRQVLISTHSAALLSDPEIEPEEVLLLKPVHEGSEAEAAGDVTDALLILDRDVDEERVPRERTLEKDPNQLNLFE